MDHGDFGGRSHAVSGDRWSALHVRRRRPGPDGTGQGQLQVGARRLCVGGDVTGHSGGPARHSRRLATVMTSWLLNGLMDALIDWLAERVQSMLGGLVSFLTATFFTSPDV